ncbi:MAG: hypothetical protein HY717_02270 [Planctomycetes bacterium]|nr:hypothetical protein [Planctomycetota bacterium]
MAEAERLQALLKPGLLGAEGADHVEASGEYSCRQSYGYVQRLGQGRIKGDMQGHRAPPCRGSRAG